MCGLGVLIIAASMLAADNGTIEGTAFNRLTQTGVPNVTVKLAWASAPDKQMYTVKSDAAGEFRIEEAREGDYVASVDPPAGFLVPENCIPSCKPFHITAAGKPTKLQVPLIPLARLRGRVRDGEGHPVSRVRVEIYLAHSSGVQKTTTTDEDGRFFSNDLVPGLYRLRARPVLADTPLADRLGRLSPSAKPSKGKNWRWMPTYFPNAVDINGAENIVVREGADLAGYEIQLRSAPAYRLRGVVSEEGGKPAGGVKLLISQSPQQRAEALVHSGRDGSFEFPAVPAGKWYISAEAKRDKTNWKGFTELMMPDHDEDVYVRITPPLVLQGIVEWVPPRLGAQSRVIVYLVRTDGEETAIVGEQPDGSLRLNDDLYPGTYRINQISEIPDYYLDAILLGTENAMGRDVFIGANSPPLRLIFKSPAARVRGWVEHGAGAKVVLVEADQEHYRPGSIRLAVCDNDGRFNIEGLRPTAYYAFASTTFNGSEYAATEAIFAGELGREAKMLRLAEGETATLQLKITPWPE